MRLIERLSLLGVQDSKPLSLPLVLPLVLWMIPSPTRQSSSCLDSIFRRHLIVLNLLAKLLALQGTVDDNS